MQCATAKDGGTLVVGWLEGASLCPPLNAHKNTPPNTGTSEATDG